MISSVTINIHTFNEEENIEECIESAKKLSKKIQVIDMNSTDKTATIAKKMGAEVYLFPYSRYVEPSRQFGIEKAKDDWVFILDADERMTDELAKEITESVEERSGKTESVKTYYKIPRKNVFGEKWLKHGDWWPDHQIRLINKKHFKNWPKEIHSTPVITGKQGFLTNLLLHYFHGNLKEMVNKTIIFEDIESDLLFKAGRQAKTRTFFRKFFGELFRRLVKERGFLDGPIGIIESIYQAFSKTITYLFLYEKYKTRRPL